MWISLLSRFRSRRHSIGSIGSIRIYRMPSHPQRCLRSLRYAERLELAFIDHSRGRFVDASLGAVLDGMSVTATEGDHFMTQQSKENKILLGGIPTPLKNMKVSWDDEIPNIWKNKKVPNHQPQKECCARCQNLLPLLWDVKVVKTAKGHQGGFRLVTWWIPLISSSRTELINAIRSLCWYPAIFGASTKTKLPVVSYGMLGWWLNQHGARPMFTSIF